MNLSEFLTFLRRELDADSAKSFHADLAKRGLECNYPTYKKIENGQLLPSATLLEQLARALPPVWRDDLVLSYSRSQFPGYAYLFPLQTVAPAAEKKSASLPVTGAGHRELTKRQVSVLARSMSHYHFFLVLILARRPVPRKDMERQFRKDFEKIRKDFEEADFLSPEDAGLSMHTTEWKFPAGAEDPGLQKTYRQFDEWDEQFAEQFEFETLLQRKIMHRVSPRFIGLIQKQLEVCVDLITTSDEVESRYNENTVILQLRLKSGLIPG